MYRVYQNRAATAYSTLYFSFSLVLKIPNFCHIFLIGNLMSTKLKRDTHMDSGWMYRVYQNLAAAS